MILTPFPDNRPRFGIDEDLVEPMICECDGGEAEHTRILFREDDPALQEVGGRPRGEIRPIVPTGAAGGVALNREVSLASICRFIWGSNRFSKAHGISPSLLA